MEMTGAAAPHPAEARALISKLTTPWETSYPWSEQWRLDADLLDRASDLLHLYSLMEGNLDLASDIISLATKSSWIYW